MGERALQIKLVLSVSITGETRDLDTDIVLVGTRVLQWVCLNKICQITKNKLTQETVIKKENRI